MKKKVLHVINSLTPGGAETLLVNSLSAGGLQEHTDNVVVYFQGTSDLEKKLDSRVKCICLHYKGLHSLPGALFKLRRIIRSYKINIVHSHLNPAGVYTHLVCPSNIPQVHTIHTTYSMDNETPPVKLFFEKHFYFKKRNCNIILLSDFTKKDFTKTIPFTGRSFVLNNFVPDAYFDIPVIKQKLPLQELKIIAIGTLKPLKNFEYLLDVFSRLTNYPVSLDIFGGGDKTAYEKLIKEKSLNIRMVGHSENMEKKMIGYDLFIMPSKFEGFPLSVFEAMAAAIPLMLSAIEPLTSIVKDNAIYFELDNAEKVAQQIIAVLQNKIDINEMAVKAKEYAEKTVRREMYIQKLLKIYGQL